MNKVIVIGWLGSRTCYVNVSREEAIKRYWADAWPREPVDEAALLKHDLISEFTFEDEFSAYDAWGPSP